MAGENCPVCVSGDAKVDRVGPLETEWLINCPTCGHFSLEHLAEIRLRNEIPKRDRKSATVSYCIRRMQSSDGTPAKVTEKLLDDFLNRKLPSAAEQADNFILWLGDQTQPGENLTVKHQEVYAHVGAYLKTGLAWIIRGMTDTLLEKSNNFEVCLSFDGWTRYSDLKKGKANAKKAFMAMPFGNEALDQVYSVFRRACADTSFSLMRLDERPKAGLIDNRLRVEIQTSRFLVVDLTNDNNGANWEG